MDLGLGFDLGSISWPLIIGAIVAMAGLGLAAIVAGSANGTKFMRVPDGVEPDEHYRRWKAASLTRRLSRGAWFLLFLSVGMSLGGCGVVILQVIR